MMVQGNVTNLRPGQHVWVLVHRVRGFPGIFWPQGRAEPDSRTGDWEVFVTFGQPQDVGYEFELAAITVDEIQHQKLMTYWRKAIRYTRATAQLVTDLPVLVSRESFLR